jgi:hypothetical protein
VARRPVQASDKLCTQVAYTDKNRAGKERVTEIHGFRGDHPQTRTTNSNPLLTTFSVATKTSGRNSD